MDDDLSHEGVDRAWTSRWTMAHGIRHILSQPERPLQNDHIESFNGKFRDECLNEHGFQTRCRQLVPKPAVNADAARGAHPAAPATAA